VLLLETLIGKGRKVRVHDPHIQLGEIYGSNQRYIMNAIRIGNLLDDRLDAMLEWADHVLVAQKPSPQIQARLEASGKPLVDLVGALRPHGAHADPRLSMQPSGRVVSVFGVNPTRIAAARSLPRAFLAPGRAWLGGVLCYQSLPEGDVRRFLELPNVTFDVLKDAWKFATRPAAIWPPS
jgi:hypothetical protein